jgi:hypothetical protein
MATLARIHEVKVRLRSDGLFERSLKGLSVNGQWLFDALIYADREALLAGKAAQDAAFMSKLEAE